MPTLEKAFIWKLHAIRLSDRWAINGVLLAGKLPKIIDGGESAMGNFTKIFRSYFNKPLADQSIIVATGNFQQEVTTNDSGEFFCFSTQEDIKPLRFLRPETGEELTIVQSYLHQFDKEHAPLLLISDIDDTILVSKSSKFLSKIRLMLFRPVSKRKAILESQQAYEELDTDQVQFAYVSGSESNLFHLLGSFFQKNNLPEGPLFLRPHVHWRQLLQPKKRAQYKTDRIQRLIEYFPDKKVVLFGDDSQHDLQVFTDIAQQYPLQIQAAFMRRTGLTKKHQGKVGSWKMEGSDVSVHYYDAFEDIASPIQQLLDENTFRD
jgi:phosphatidate phosphatase APP1